MDPFKNLSCNPSKTLSNENIYRNYMKGAANKYSVKVNVRHETYRFNPMFLQEKTLTKFGNFIYTG